MALTLTILSLSLCGGLLSDSTPSARLFAQNEELIPPPMPSPEDDVVAPSQPNSPRGPSREELQESMPGLGGPIGLIVGGGVLVFATYLLPLFLPFGAVTLVAIVMVITGGILASVGIGTLIGNIVRRARIQKQIRRLERGGMYGLESPTPDAPAPALAMLTFQLP